MNLRELLAPGAATDVSKPGSVGPRVAGGKKTGKKIKTWHQNNKTRPIRDCC